MDDLCRFCCLDSACPDHGTQDAKHLTLTLTARSDPAKAKRMLRCHTCKARCSEPKGTPLFDPRLPSSQVESVLEPIYPRTTAI